MRRVSRARILAFMSCSMLAACRIFGYTAIGLTTLLGTAHTNRPGLFVFQLAGCLQTGSGDRMAAAQYARKHDLV